jgi:hypothetical protein
MSTANFHEPSFCRFSTWNPFPSQLVGGASGDSLNWDSCSPQSHAQPPRFECFCIWAVAQHLEAWVLGAEFLMVSLNGLLADRRWASRIEVRRILRPPRGLSASSGLASVWPQCPLGAPIRWPPSRWHVSFAEECPQRLGRPSRERVLRETR